MTTELLTFFQYAVNFALLLSVQLLVILALRKPVCRWFGAANAYRLWLLPVVWLPFMLLDPAWLTPDLSALFGTGPATGSTAEPTLFDPLLSLLPLSFDLAGTDAITATRSVGARIWLGIGIVWLAGTSVLLGVLLYQLAAFGLYVRRSAATVPADTLATITGKDFTSATPVLFLDGMRSPALFGFLHPVLLLPADFFMQFDADERHIMLAHEAVHLRRRDNVWNLCAGLLKVLFWINPLVHLAWRRFRLDQELACDAQALHSCDTGQSKRFARTLLETAGRTSALANQVSLTAWDSLHELRERSVMIRHHLQRSTHPRAARLCLLLVALGGAATTAIVSNSVSTPVLAAQANPESPSLSPEFYADIQQVMELRDGKDYGAATTLLNQIKLRYDAGLLNVREIYTLWMFYASIAQAQEDYLGALQHYEQILQLENVPADQLQQAYMMAGSLHFALAEFEPAIAYLKQALAMHEKPGYDILLRIATAYYQLGQFAEAAPYAEQGIAAQSDTPQHSSYALLRAIYLTLDDYVQARRVASDMVALFDEPEDERLLESIDLQLRNQ